VELFSNWRPSAMLDLDFKILGFGDVSFVIIPVCCTAYRASSMKYGDIAIFKIAIVCHLEFS